MSPQISSTFLYNLSILSCMSEAIQAIITIQWTEGLKQRKFTSSKSGGLKTEIREAVRLAYGGNKLPNFLTLWGRGAQVSSFDSKGTKWLKESSAL